MDKSRMTGLPPAAPVVKYHRGDPWPFTGRTAKAPPSGISCYVPVGPPVVPSGH